VRYDDGGREAYEAGDHQAAEREIARLTRDAARRKPFSHLA
jgi:hypothetical protein